MKNILMIVLFLLGTYCYSQVKLNEQTKIYQYDVVMRSNNKNINHFEKKLIELDFKEIRVIDDQVFAKNFFTKLISGSAMEIHYTIKIANNNILFSNFKINDVRYGTIALEELKNNSKKRWIEYINERIPEIINRIEPQ